MLGLPELPQLWAAISPATAVIGSIVGAIGLAATLRARRIEARYKGPELYLVPSRQDEEGWVQMLLLVRNRLDIEMTIESVEVLRPRRGVVLGMEEWNRRSATNVPPRAVAGFGHIVHAGPADARHSAKLPLFIRKAGWDPQQRPARLRVILRENSMDRQKRVHTVLSTLMRPPPPQAEEEQPVMRRPRDPWIAYGGERGGGFWAT